MRSEQTPKLHPAEQLLGLTARTLWVLYGAFWLSVVVYAGIVLVFSYATGGPAGDRARGFGGIEMALGLVQVLMLAAGAGSLLLVAWTARILQRTERLWGGTQDLEGLAARLTQRRAPRWTGAGEPGTPEEQRQRSMAGAVQHLLGRVVMAHLVPWVIAEVPAVLGLLDRFLSGRRSVWPVMIALSAAGLLLARPSRDRLRQIFDPIYRAAPRSGE